VKAPKTHNQIGREDVQKTLCFAFDSDPDSDGVEVYARSRDEMVEALLDLMAEVGNFACSAAALEYIALIEGWEGTSRNPERLLTDESKATMARFLIEAVVFLRSDVVRPAKHVVLASKFEDPEEYFFGETTEAA
jgi:hypothetical protein